MVPVINYDDFAVEMLPDDQRLQGWEIFTKALLSPNKRLYNLLDRYMNGSDDLDYWDGATTYAKGDMVKDLYGVYESKGDGNIGNDLRDTDSWLHVLDSFIGKRESAHYNGRYLYFTYALNRIFGTTFKQPPYPPPYDFGTGSGTFSHIYITNDTPVYTSFVSFPTAAGTSVTYPTRSRGTVFPVPVYTTASSYKFKIHIPVAVYNALGTSGAIREAVVRGFADKYAATGTTYTIVTY